MHQRSTENLEDIYPVCRRSMAPDAWDHVKDSCNSSRGPEGLPQVLSSLGNILRLPLYLAELALLEWTLHRTKTAERDSTLPVEQLAVNPSLHLLCLSWKNLPQQLTAPAHGSVPSPEMVEEYVIVWTHPKTREAFVRPATDEDLLVLKMVAEEIAAEEVAAISGGTVHELQAAIDRAVGKGLLIAPPSGLRRDSSDFPIHEGVEEAFLTSSIFTLQWHITQACDLHCRHCYDRSDARSLELSQAMTVLDDLHEFCRNRKVRGQVSFTGGNPFLYPHFVEVYRGASERGFSLAILGNPVSQKLIEKIIAIETPVYYQVSLEGLQEHNDFIRGPGHFERVLEFLHELRRLGIYSMVMLTLTRDNLPQVLPLAEMLRGRADLFTFNRLSLVGEGAALKLPSKSAYVAFLKAYSEAVEHNPVLALKDNLLNVIRHQSGLPVFGGCTGYGCGAAFNFLCLLADGSVHACRKFPSPIGNVLDAGLGELYDSATARRYRSGSRACRSCTLRPVCGGCLAITHSFGLDVFEERDPYCFIGE